MSIPFLDLSHQHVPLRAEIESALRRVLDSGQFILGEETRRLEVELAERCGGVHAVAVASGTDGLFLALAALGVGPGDEVVTTPFTFIATGTAIVRAGARPVFADVDRTTCNLDPERAAAAITPRTRAILPVDLYGLCADWESFESLAKEKGLRLVEDAAQSIGASRGGRRAGSFGDAASFSFYPTKNLGGMGDGGLVTTGDADLASKIRLLRAHGDTGGYQHSVIGLNSRLDAFQAAVLRVKLTRLDDWSARRRRTAALYSELLGGIFGGDGSPLRLPPRPGPGEVPAWHQYVIRAERRDDLAAFLKGKEIGCAIYYPVPLHHQPCFREIGLGEGDLPEAERACREVLALPIYPGLGEEQVREVCEGIASFYGARGR